MDQEYDVKDRIENYLNEEYEGGYRASIDIDEERGEAIVSVFFEKNSEVITLGELLEELVEEAGVERPNVKMDYEPGKGKYNLRIAEPRIQVRELL